MDNHQIQGSTWQVTQYRSLLVQQKEICSETQRSEDRRNAQNKHFLSLNTCLHLEN